MEEHKENQTKQPLSARLSKIVSVQNPSIENNNNNNNNNINNNNNNNNNIWNNSEAVESSRSSSSCSSVSFPARSTVSGPEQGNFQIQSQNNNNFNNNKPKQSISSLFPHSDAKNIINSHQTSIKRALSNPSSNWDPEMIWANPNNQFANQNSNQNSNSNFLSSKLSSSYQNDLSNDFNLNQLQKSHSNSHSNQNPWGSVGQSKLWRDDLSKLNNSNSFLSNYPTKRSQFINTNNTNNNLSNSISPTIIGLENTSTLPNLSPRPLHSDINQLDQMISSNNNTNNNNNNNSIYFNSVLSDSASTTSAATSPFISRQPLLGSKFSDNGRRCSDVLSNVRKLSIEDSFSHSLSFSSHNDNLSHASFPLNTIPNSTSSFRAHRSSMSSANGSLSSVTPEGSSPIPTHMTLTNNIQQPSIPFPSNLSYNTTLPPSLSSLSSSPEDRRQSPVNDYSNNVWRTLSNASSTSVESNVNTASLKPVSSIGEGYTSSSFVPRKFDRHFSFGDAASTETRRPSLYDLQASYISPRFTPSQLASSNNPSGMTDLSSSSAAPLSISSNNISSLESFNRSKNNTKNINSPNSYNSLLNGGSINSFDISQNSSLSSQQMSNHSASIMGSSLPSNVPSHLINHNQSQFEFQSSSPTFNSFSQLLSGNSNVISNENNTTSKKSPSTQHSQTSMPIHMPMHHTAFMNGNANGNVVRIPNSTSTANSSSSNSPVMSNLVTSNVKYPNLMGSISQPQPISIGAADQQFSSNPNSFIEGVSRNRQSGIFASNISSSIVNNKNQLGMMAGNFPRDDLVQKQQTVSGTNSQNGAAPQPVNGVAAASGSYRSALLDEFRANKSRKYELNDLHGHVLEFSRDQHGSRFIQQKLETATEQEMDELFAEIKSTASQLMTDVFGNYVIQKFFEYGSKSQKDALVSQIKGHILPLSLQMYGCRVVQKAIEFIDEDQKAELIRELDQNVLKCVKDQNGNHVVQKAIECVPSVSVQFIIDAFHQQVFSLATHPYGCRVIQRMLEHCDDASRIKLMSELHVYTSFLVQDQYGNYVIQHVIEHGSTEDRSMIINIVKESLVAFSKHKFASNVVEKCIMFGNVKQRQDLIDEILRVHADGSIPLTIMMRDQFANYVIQKLLDVTEGTQRELLVSKIKPHLQALKKVTYGKHLVSIERLIYLSHEKPSQQNQQHGQSNSSNLNEENLDSLNSNLSEEANRGSNSDNELKHKSKDSNGSSSHSSASNSVNSTSSSLSNSTLQNYPQIISFGELKMRPTAADFPCLPPTTNNISIQSDKVSPNNFGKISDITNGRSGNFISKWNKN